MGVCRALALFGDAKQPMGEGKSGPVETGLTGPVATALTSIKEGRVSLSIQAVPQWKAISQML